MNGSDKKQSVLIVDDEKSIILALTDILGLNYKIHALLDSQRTVHVAEEEKPDLIILDVFMPEMDGFEVITLLKLNDKTKHIPVVFITGLDNRKAEENGLMLGAVDYITKPFQVEVVKQRIENQLKKLL